MLSALASICCAVTKAYILRSKGNLVVKVFLCLILFIVFSALWFSIVLYIAQNFGRETALKKLEEIESEILKLGSDPYIGTEPRYPVLRRQGYRVLILEKDLVFYKVDEINRRIVIYAVVDQRQDYLNIIRGL